MTAHLRTEFSAASNISDKQWLFNTPVSKSVKEVMAVGTTAAKQPVFFDDINMINIRML
jgi:hypothetical protein